MMTSRSKKDTEQFIYDENPTESSKCERLHESESGEEHVIRGYVVCVDVHGDEEPDGADRSQEKDPWPEDNMTFPSLFFVLEEGSRPFSRILKRKQQVECEMRVRDRGVSAPRVNSRHHSSIFPPRRPPPYGRGPCLREVFSRRAPCP